MTTTTTAMPLFSRVMESVATLDNEEVLASLLSLHTPTRKISGLVQRLRDRFGDTFSVINADAASLLSVEGMTPGAVSVIKISQSLAVRLIKGRIDERDVLGSWQQVIDYLTADMATAGCERVRCLYLNCRNQLLRDEVVSEGSVDEAAVYVRQVIRRALDLGASAMILVHNHPSGDPTPSRQDIRLTREIIAAGRPLGVTVHDHVIIGNGKHSSMRGAGLL